MSLLEKYKVVSLVKADKKTEIIKIKVIKNIRESVFSILKKAAVFEIICISNNYS